MANAWTAFEQEALPHMERLFRVAMWLERDRAEAEDLVQETMIRALESFHRFTIGTNCRAWLMTILRNVRSNRKRSRRRTPVPAEIDTRFAETIAFVPPVPERLSDEDLLAALADLPEQYQEVILLCDVEEFTYKEISDTLRLPLGTVMSRLHRGRARLREKLDRESAGLKRSTRAVS